MLKMVEIQIEKNVPLSSPHRRKKGESVYPFLAMSNDLFFYSKSGFAPYSDGSGFKVTVTIEQDTEDSEPTISIESVWRVPVSEWVEASCKIERLLDLVTRPSSSVAPHDDQRGGAV